MRLRIIPLEANDDFNADIKDVKNISTFISGTSVAIDSDIFLVPDIKFEIVNNSLQGFILPANRRYALLIEEE